MRDLRLVSRARLGTSSAQSGDWLNSIMGERSFEQAGQRHEVIDALRGFALTGVCMVNLVSLSLYEFLSSSARQSLASTWFDSVAEQAMAWLVNIKFITIFSLLFGLGFALPRASRMGMAVVDRWVPPEVA